MNNLAARRIPGVTKTVMVYSGKGGVGKSTIAVNVAVGLARRGCQVGLLDLDLYGPTIPRLMGFINDHDNNDDMALSVQQEDDKGPSFVPLTNYGVKCMSMGFLGKKGGSGSPLAWRGLMVMKAVQHLLWNVQWGRLEYLIVDMPPGTGDTQLTVCQQALVDGALIVTTPQRVALTAAEKGIVLMNKMRVPIIGIVENMKDTQCPKCKCRVQLFGDHTRELSEKYSVPIVASLPMEPRHCAEADVGRPAAFLDSRCYEQLLSSIHSALEQK